MNRTSHIRLMADYNAWMNAKLCDAARRLPDEALAADRRAYFGSIPGTLNHLVVGDTLWLKRFATHPAAYPALDAARRQGATLLSQAGVDVGVTDLLALIPNEETGHAG